jgi:primase-polymerase (primpol)-like protein
MSPRTFNRSDLLNLPQALAPLCAQDRWVAWRWQQGGKKSNWTKPPLRAFQPDQYAASDDPETWAPHCTAVSAVSRGAADGIGFMLSNSEVAAIDLDACRNVDSGEIAPWAMEILNKAPSAYKEVTVSGTGLRIIGYGTGTAVHRKFSISTDGNKRAGIELYRRATRFITVSGAEMGVCTTLPNIDALIDDLLARHAKASKAPKASTSTRTAEPVLTGSADIDGIIRNGAERGQRSTLFAKVVWSLATHGQTIDQIHARTLLAISLAPVLLTSLACL